METVISGRRTLMRRAAFAPIPIAATDGFCNALIPKRTSLVFSAVLRTTIPANMAATTRVKRQNMLIPLYTQRHFRLLGTWDISGWHLKAYGISAHAPEKEQFLQPELITEARSFVEANLGRMEGTPHYSVGFAILHHGSSAKTLLTQWWVNECVCMQYAAQSNYSGSPKFSFTRGDLMACAYELVAIDFERRAWVSTVMSGKPIEDYLESWLPDGLY